MIKLHDQCKGKMKLKWKIYMVSINKVGIIGTGTGLLFTSLFRFYYFDLVYVGVVLHEFGHKLGLEHHEDIYCIMNNEHTIWSYIKKLNYGINFCPHCKELIIQYLNYHNIKDVNLYILIVGYQYNGNIFRVSKEIEKRFNEILNEVNSVVSVEYFEIKEKIEKDFIIMYNEIIENKIFEILSNNGIDYKKYIWMYNNMICELNNPPSSKMDKWGYASTISYAFPPAIFYAENLFLYSLVPITVSTAISVVK